MLFTTYETNDGLTKRPSFCKEPIWLEESVKLNQDGNYAYETLENFTGYICEKELENSQLKLLGDHQVELI